MIRAARKSIAIAVAAIVTLAAPAGAQTPPAADFPGRAIKFVVPGPVGGPTDTLCRLVADKLRQSFGHPVVVENRPGAVGSIGASAVAIAQPTGHTLLCTPDAPIILSPLINKGLSYDPAAFEPVISLEIPPALRRESPVVAGLRWAGVTLMLPELRELRTRSPEPRSSAPDPLQTCGAPSCCGAKCSVYPILRVSLRLCSVGGAGWRTMPVDFVTRRFSASRPGVPPQSSRRTY